MRTSISLILLFLISISVFSQTREALDSLNNLTKSIVCRNDASFDSLSNHIIEKSLEKKYFVQLGQALIIKAYGERCKGDFQSSARTLKEAISSYEMEGNVQGKVKALTHLFSSMMSLGKMDSAGYYARYGVELALTQDDSLIIASAYLTKSSFHSIISEQDSIIIYALKGLKVLGDIQNDQLKGGFSMGLGNAYNQNEDYRKAIEYYRKAKQYFHEESESMTRIYHNMGSAFSELDDNDSSFYYLFKSIEINKKYERKLLLTYNYQALANSYADVNDCSKSIEYNLLSLTMSDELGEKTSKAGVLSNLSECYVKIGQFNKAVESAQKAVFLTQETGDQDTEANAYFLLSEAFKAQGRYKEAFEAHKSFYSLDSLLLNRDKQSTIATIETEYQTEKKEAEIASLSQQASIQALEIQQKNQALIIGLVVFLFVLAAIYFIYKQRETKKIQSQTELEQRFLRSQLNPHFISNALVAVQSFMLKNDSESAALYLTKFSKLMREILENSRKEFIPVEEEISMLKNFLDIHKLRLGSFEYTVELDENIDPETDTIPPMFVQPFLENSVEHGIGELKEGGKIDLKFKKEGDYISIAVNDNGKGLSSEKSVGHTSLSTTIIQERMNLFNRSLKKKIQLVVDNIMNDKNEVSGTRVELKVPFS